MVALDINVSPIYTVYLRNFVTPNTIASPSRSIWAYLFSAGASVRDTNAICLCEPSAIRWESTAPMPYGEASQLSTSGNLEL